MLPFGAERIRRLEPTIGAPARKIVSTWVSNEDPAKWRRLILDHPGGIFVPKTIGTTVCITSQNVPSDQGALMRGG
jgi:hypothetical protein